MCMFPFTTGSVVSKILTIPVPTVTTLKYFGQTEKKLWCSRMTESKDSKKAPPSGLVIPPKKPKLSKAERRALQEQQRAAKSGGGGSSNSSNVPPKDGNVDTVATLTKKVSKLSTTSVESSGHASKIEDGNNHKSPVTSLSTSVASKDVPPTKPQKSKEIALLSHLPPYRGTFRGYIR
jgi:hypothetical protein